jgi:hypothetical protein
MRIIVFRCVYEKKALIFYFSFLVLMRLYYCFFLNTKPIIREIIYAKMRDYKSNI